MVSRHDGISSMGRSSVHACVSWWIQHTGAVLLVPPLLVHKADNDLGTCWTVMFALFLCVSPSAGRLAGYWDGANKGRLLPGPCLPYEVAAVQRLLCRSYCAVTAK